MKFLRSFGYMNDTIYKYMVWLVQIGIPSISTLYYSLSMIWNFNHREEVLATSTAVCTFLGVCLGISSTNYKEDHKDNEQ